RRHHGVYLLPADYTPGQRYPMLTWVYPETVMEKRTRFGAEGVGVWNFQLFATRGYVVFFPDVFAHPGTWATDIPASVLPGIDKLIAMGIADSTRLGIGGHSNGGYSTMALVECTDRFKAAFASAGPYDPYIEYFGLDATGNSTGVVGMELDEGGSPWDAG